MKDFKENLQKCQSYIQALEEERRKIQVFQRELPLCLELVTQAIDACKQQLSGASNGITRGECLNNRQNNNNNSECTSDNGPIFEEFIPLKRSHCSDDDDDDDEHHDFHKDEMSDDHINHDDHDDVDKSEEKSDWLRSVQLWNQTPDPPTSHQEQQPKRVQVVEVTNSAQQKIENHEKIKANSDVKKSSVEPANSTCTDAKVVAGGRPTGSSSAGGGSTKEEKGVQRKSRRCWSPELHKRFLHALQQLGGSHAATPKQIRELMKVDGLTNDEVKSHLQKYRLHTRRPTSTTSNNNSNSQQSHQFVVGGIWMPSSEYNSMAPIATNSRETSPISAPNIYTPIATMASPSSNSQREQHKQASQSHEERGSHSHGGVHSNSTSTSSSTHTTTASQSH